jgi:hypothetical protein
LSDGRRAEIVYTYIDAPAGQVKSKLNTTKLKMAKYNKSEIESAKVQSGPYSLFHNTFLLELLEIPEALDAT